MIWWAAAAALLFIFGAWPQFWDRSQGLTPAGWVWYGPTQYFAYGDNPAYREYHWHGLPLVAGNSFVLAGLAALIGLTAAAIRLRTPAVRASRLPQAGSAGCASAVASADLGKLRSRMVSQVAASGRPVSDAVARAMRAVPRHLFLPGTDPELAYRNEPIVTRRSADGQPTSSSSQPTIMAYMLDQLDVAPGQRVLEIGAGTGYNAALLAHLVGAAGTVVTVDLDEEVADQARAHLAAAGYPDVTVLAADGAAGYPPGAPYDRIIATVGVSDLAPAWREQLGPGGRIVVPLDLRGSQRSVAFEWDGTSWQSRSVIPCGFMRMRGTLAGPNAPG